ncbi:MAG: hypothetical protein WC223_06510 [Bacteroidales bacterium]
MIIIIFNLLLICSSAFAQTYTTADSTIFVSERDIFKQNIPKSAGVVSDFERILYPQ